MQLKLYKRSTLMLGFILLLSVFACIGLIIYKDLWIENKVLTIVIFVSILLVLMLIYSSIDLNYDKNLVRKAVRNGDVALVKINGGTFVRFARDARLQNHVYWKMNVELYDNDMNMIKTTMIEKFNPHQTSIPKGFIFVTYKKGHEEDSLAIPNIIISSIPEYQPFVEDYEKHIHPKYLNCYYNHGLIIQTYEDSIKLEKEMKEFDDKLERELEEKLKKEEAEKNKK